MKISRHTLGIAIAVLALGACNNGFTPQETNKGQAALDQLEERAEAAKTELNNTVEGLKVDISKLISANAITTESLGAVFPNSLGGLNRSKLERDNASLRNFTKMEADYEEVGNPKSISLKITDGAGKEGTRILEHVLRNLQSGREKSSRDEYEKSANILGHQAWVKEKTAANDREAEIKLVHADRYIVEIEGEGYSLDELTNILKDVDLSSLK